MIQFNLRNFRLKNTNITASQMARFLRMGVSHYCSLESSSKRLKIEKLNLICKILNCQPSDFLIYIPDESVSTDSTENQPETLDPAN